MKRPSRVEVIVLMDRDSLSNAFITEYALSILIRAHYQKKIKEILFDTGISWSKVVYNAMKMGYNIGKIRTFFISHWHRDHAGGFKERISLGGEDKLKAYSPDDKRALREVAKKHRNLNVVVCKNKTTVIPGIYSTGTIASSREHALKIELVSGKKVLIIGCGHAGLMNIIKWSSSNKEILHAIMGGFHLKNEASHNVRLILRNISNRVERVIPLHCSNHKRVFKEVLKDKYTPGGVGLKVVFE